MSLKCLVLGRFVGFVIKGVLTGNNERNWRKPEMVIRDSNFHFWFCSVFLCLGLAEASGVIALQQLRGVLKSSRELFSLE